MHFQEPAEIARSGLFASLQITFSRLRFVLVPVDAVRLPGFAGFTLRGALGMALRRLYCPPDGSCRRPIECPYHYLFETPRRSDAGRWVATHDPHPFVLEPPLEARELCRPGEPLAFHLVLIGRGMEFLPYVVAAVEAQGQWGLGPERGRYILLRVEDASPGPQAGQQLIFDGPARRFVNGPRTMTVGQAGLEGEEWRCTTKVALRFLTPTRLKQRGRLTDALDFSLLVRSLLRRVWWLAEAHCDQRWEGDYRELLTRAEKVRVARSDLRWQDWTRYSARQRQRLLMGGFMGEVEFEGELSSFLPLLKMGEALHVGKGTVYGLGWYRLSSIGHEQLV
jgi:CRISPR/Cas system endoribonuclease Cas6 (RAMP superfamily)